MITRKLKDYRDELRRIQETLLSAFVNEWTKLRDLGDELDKAIQREERKQAVFRIETGEREQDGNMANS